VMGRKELNGGLRAISVLILLPVYTDESRIQRALDSVMKQRGVDFILYVLDNNSRDNSFAIIQQYSNYQNVKIFQNERTLKPYENWKKVYWLAKKESFTHICYIASDDYWDGSDYLKCMAETLSSDKDTKVVFPNFVNFSTSNSEHYEFYRLKADVPSSIARRFFLLGNWSYVYLNYSIFEAEFFEKIMNGKFSRFSNYIGSDWWLTYEILRSTKPVHSKSSNYYKDFDRVFIDEKLSRMQTIHYYIGFPYRHVILELKRFSILDIFDFIIILIWSVSFAIGKIIFLVAKSLLRRVKHGN
jgi:glycosyltransferase involved in cell wall biosynthesis